MSAVKCDKCSSLHLSLKGEIPTSGNNSSDSGELDTDVTALSLDLETEEESSSLPHCSTLITPNTHISLNTWRNFFCLFVFVLFLFILLTPLKPCADNIRKIHQDWITVRRTLYLVHGDDFYLGYIPRKLTSWDMVLMSFQIHLFTHHIRANPTSDSGASHAFYIQSLRV